MTISDIYIASFAERASQDSAGGLRNPLVGAGSEIR